MQKLTIEQSTFQVEVTDENVHINKHLVYDSKKGFVTPETKEKVIISEQFCKAVNSGGDTTVIFVDSHIFDSNDYEIELVLTKKKQTNDE